MRRHDATFGAYGKVGFDREADQGVEPAVAQRASGVKRIAAGVVSAVHWVFAAEVPKPESAEQRAERTGPTPHPRIRFWVALSIVVAAVSAAAAAWRAEIFTEYATQKEALFRQDLIGQQLSERLDEETVASGLRHFGNYEQAALLADQLQREADLARGSRASALGAEAQNERMLANVDLTTDYALDAVTLPGKEVRPADAASGYAWMVMSDPTLATFDPADRDADAHLARSDAVRMAGVAVLFALAVLLLTLSEIRLRRITKPPETGWTVGHTLWAGAILIWLGSAAWFTILMLDVPGLR
jgi:hypothetical protein